MPKLLVYFIRMNSKDFYLTINIIDILMCAISTGLFQANTIITIKHIYSSWMWLLDLILLVAAICALVSYFSKRYHRTSTHFAYMIIRIFTSIFQFISFTSLLIVILKSISNNTKRHPNAVIFAYILFMEVYSLLSLYWSYHLMKIIN